MNNKKLSSGFWNVFSFTAIVIILTGTSGCSSGSSKSTRMESSPPRASSEPATTTPPVLSNPVKPKVQKTPPSPSPSRATGTPQVSSKSSETMDSATRQKRSYKRKKAPTEKQGDSLDALLGTTPTMTAQESSSGSSIRGLSPVSESYGKDHKISDDILDSVRKMERFEISDEEIRRFQKAGKLNRSAP
ncbi:MAG: hypothetical protein G3M70_17780 [Candidatus Nitronauta litoralis]|uniref:Uncharacterized protein n=1 Tax=Candidatus Nitronauta litoralis TaxID=2705533 RepID=A0A7T0G1I5_9BACT|nr:MAG: hypothetical protein G3M70_17780 [Candidatus Nitronauta litoralis]